MRTEREVESGERAELLVPNERRRRGVGRRCEASAAEQGASLLEARGGVRSGVQAVVADLDETGRQDVLHETAEKFGDGQRGRIAVARLEADATLVERKQPAVGDRDAMCVAAEVGEDLLGSGERGLAVDDPAPR